MFTLGAYGTRKDLTEVLWEPGNFANGTIKRSRTLQIDREVRDLVRRNQGHRYILFNRLIPQFTSGKRQHSGMSLIHDMGDFSNSSFVAAVFVNVWIKLSTLPTCSAAAIVVS